jgi:hypothetical protein
MPQVAIDHVEIRWRRADAAGAWTVETLKPGLSSLSLVGVEPGVNYEVQARYVGVNGAASRWMPQTHKAN